MEKLPLKVKLCYGAGSMGKVVQGLAGSTFLLYFYTEILGVSPGISASVIFFGKLFDIINDPLIGAAVDRVRSEEGKCRIFLKYGAIPAGFLLALCFFCPGNAKKLKIVWIAVTYGLQATASSFIQIPMNTLMGRLSQDEQQRSHLNQISGLVSLAGNFIVTSLTLPLAAAAGGGNMRNGFFAVGICYGTVYALSYLIVYAGTRGCEPAEPARLQRKEEAPGIGAVIGALLKNKIWLCIGLYYLFDMIAATLESTAMVYYFQYNLGDTGLLSVFSAVAMVSNALVFSSLHLFTRKLGNAGTTILGCCLSMSGDLLRFALHDGSFAVMFCGWILSALGSCMVAGTVLLNLFDAKVYGEWKTGIRSEALLMSGFTLATKVGMAVGSAAVGWLLLLVPYTEGAESQPQPVLDLFFGLNTLLPAVVFFLVLILSIPVLKMERKLPQMRRELAERAERKKK